MSLLTDSTIWHDLQNHFAEVADLQMRDMFDNDSKRFGKYSLSLNDILFDYSKNIV